MDDQVFAVIWRLAPEPWRLAQVCNSREDAEFYLGLIKIDSASFEYAIVSGPIVNPLEMEKAYASLGAF